MIVIGPIIVIVQNVTTHRSGSGDSELENDYPAICAWCGWSHDGYSTAGNAKKALARHQGHCKQNPFPHVFGSRKR